MRYLARSLLVLSFLIAGPGLCPAAGRILHHDLDLRLSPAHQSLEAVDVLTVEIPATGRLDFLLSPGIEVRSLTVEGRNLPFDRDDGHLSFRIPEPLPPTAHVRIDYHGVFADAAPGDPVNTEDPSFGVSGTISPQGALLLPESGWYPDLPGSIPTFRLAAEGPAGYETVAAGRRLERSTAGDRNRSVWETDHPLRGLAIAAGPYQVAEKRVRGIPVYTYFYPGKEALSATYLDAAVHYLNLYLDRFGPYPFAKFAIVENFFPTGYGFPSWTLIGGRVLALPFIVDTSLGHEIAHSWWGNGVWIDPAGGNWSEGLTTYVADYLYRELESPEAARDYRLKILRDYSTLVPTAEDYPLIRFIGRESARDQAIGYGKGAMVFHMIRQRVGDRAFWAGLRRVAEERMFQETSWRELIDLLGRAGEVDLSPFFHQWVERAGAPQLALRAINVKEGRNVWTVNGILAQTPPTYMLEVPLLLDLGPGKESTTLVLTGEDQAFQISATSRPRQLVADPEVDIFRRLAPEEIPPSVNGIRGSEDLVVVDAGTLSPPVLSAAETLLAALGRDRQDVVSMSEFTLRNRSGKDILFLGRPTVEAYPLSFPSELTIGPQGFTLFGSHFADPDSALFVALPHPREQGHQIALFLPLSPAAATTAGRKIPHYGKFSYLAFSAGQTPVKGIWPVRHSPLVHPFDVPESPSSLDR